MTLSHGSFKETAYLCISSREGFNTGNWVTIVKRPGGENPDQGLQEI